MSIKLATKEENMTISTVSPHNTQKKVYYFTLYGLSHAHIKN